MSRWQVLQQSILRCREDSGGHFVRRRLPDRPRCDESKSSRQRTPPATPRQNPIAYNFRSILAKADWRSGHLNSETIVHFTPAGPQGKLTEIKLPSPLACPSDHLGELLCRSHQCWPGLSVRRCHRRADWQSLPTATECGLTIPVASSRSLMAAAMRARLVLTDGKQNIYLLRHVCRTAAESAGRG